MYEVINEEKYQLGIDLIESKEYEDAIFIFQELNDYKGSKDYIDFVEVF